MKEYCCDRLRAGEYSWIRYFNHVGWATTGVDMLNDEFPAHVMRYCLFCGRKLETEKGG